MPLLYEEPAPQGAETVLGKGSALSDVDLVRDYFEWLYIYANRMVYHLCGIRKKLHKFKLYKCNKNVIQNMG